MTKNQWTNMIEKSLKGQKGNIIDTKRGKRLQIEKEKNTDKQEKFKVERKILNEVNSKV